MKQTVNFRATTSVLSTFVCLSAALWTTCCWAQAAAEVDVAQSMGVGLKSRFASGATPVELSRTAIIPGTPMNVSSTMGNIMASNTGNSFGGILSRYDTSNFGKFFGTGTLTTNRTNSSRIDALDNLGQTDNEVENVEVERMYPPRLVLDFKEFPMRALKSSEAKTQITSQVENVISRFNFDPKQEDVRIETDGATVFVRGKVQSGRMARLIESVINLQAGVEEVVNELQIAEPENGFVDVFGQPARAR